MVTTLEKFKVIDVACGNMFTVFLTEERIKKKKSVKQMAGLSGFVDQLKEQNIRSLRAVEKDTAENRVLQRIIDWHKTIKTQNNAQIEVKLNHQTIDARDANEIVMKRCKIKLKLPQIYKSLKQPAYVQT